MTGAPVPSLSPAVPSRGSSDECHGWGKFPLEHLNRYPVAFGAMMSLAMAPQTPIVLSAAGQGPEKPNEVIDLVFRGGTTSPLGPLQHDLYNVILAWSQILLRTSPPDISAPDDEIRNEFEFPLSTVAGLCGYGSQKARGEGSKNMKFFISAALGLRDRSVLFSGMERLTEEGTIPNERRLKSVASEQGGFVQLVSALNYDQGKDTLVVELPKTLCRRLLQSEATTRLSALILPFTSRAACVLWELYQKHRSEGSLPKRNWKVWSRLLSADRSPHRTFREFNKVLRRAVVQVNDLLVDHELDVRYAKQGRAVDSLWFVLNRKVQPTLALGSTLNCEAVALLVKYGVRKDEGVMLASRFTPEHVRRNVEYALAKHRQSPKKNLGGYIVKAVLEDWGYSRPAGSVSLADRKTSERPLANAEAREQGDQSFRLLLASAQVMPSDDSTRSKAKAWLSSLDEAQQASVLEVFRRTAPALQRGMVEGERNLAKSGPLGLLAKWVEDRLNAGLGLPELPIDITDKNSTQATS